MFAYGPAAGDEVKQINTQEGAVQLPVPINYYGQTFSTAYVSQLVSQSMKVIWF